MRKTIQTSMQPNVPFEIRMWCGTKVQMRNVWSSVQTKTKPETTQYNDS